MGDPHWEGAEVKVTKSRRGDTADGVGWGRCRQSLVPVPHLPTLSLQGSRGELLLSLCYNPSANSIIVNIIKARNLKAMDIGGTSGVGAPPLWAGFRFPLGGWECSHSGPHLSPALVPPLSIFRGGATPVGAGWIPLGGFWKQVKRGQHCRVQEIPAVSVTSGKIWPPWGQGPRLHRQ